MPVVSRGAYVVRPTAVAAVVCREVDILPHFPVPQWKA